MVILLSLYLNAAATSKLEWTIVWTRLDCQSRLVRSLPHNFAGEVNLHPRIRLWTQ